MKALELTIYPKPKPIPRFTYSGDPYPAQDRERARARKLIESKRLTDPELAAEWHYQDNRCGQKCEGYGVAHDGTSMGSEEDEIEMLRIVHRFATLPHYDEEPTK